LKNSLQFRDKSSLSWNSFHVAKVLYGRSRWPRSLRRASAAARLLGFLDLISPVAWALVSCRCYVLSGRVLCVGPITRPEKSHRVVFLSVIAKPQQWDTLDKLELSNHKKWYYTSTFY